MPRSPLCRFSVFAVLFALAATVVSADEHKHHHAPIAFSLESVQDGPWSEPATWKPARIPKQGDRVKISGGTTVVYDVQSDAAIRLLQVVGTLRFARDRDTLLNVGILKVQSSNECTEGGFACDFENVTKAGEPLAPPSTDMPTLEVGTLDEPIPAKFTARIRLHYFEGMDKDDAPAIVCCSSRMELHGAPLARTWSKLDRTAKAGDAVVTLADDPDGWKVGDEIIVTGSERSGHNRHRNDPDAVRTEERLITRIEGRTLHLDAPLTHAHYGEGEFRSEVANLSRNVIVESADPDGVRGHTMYHAFSQGGISYARFAHLGKESVLGRYAIHYHLVSDTMRGSQILGAAVVDSHNRWITIHGTEYLVVRDCVGYRSVGHGYFMEDGTEVYNVLDRNLGVQAYMGKRLPKQVLPFDPNDGAAFWWSNGRNTLVRNVACENDEYGFRYDMQHSRYFSSHLSMTMPDGERRVVDVRTIPIWRFEDNESHTEGLYGLVVAANGNQQPDSPIRNDRDLEQINRIDWTGPDPRHPHRIRNFTLWEGHYALRPHSPNMRLENVRIHRAAYGIYRPAFENHEYVNLHISDVGAEPFNRGMDDASAQQGTISVDGLIFEHGYGNQSTPLVQISDNNLSGGAESHFRNVLVRRTDQYRGRWPLFNRGVGTQAPPVTSAGVPIYVHDHFGSGRHALVVSTKSPEFLAGGQEFRSEPGITGDQARVAEVTGVEWPRLLDPVDDVPPATIITRVVRNGDRVVVQGISHDDGKIVRVSVNDQAAQIVAENAGVVDWQITLNVPADEILTARAEDEAGNRELTPHQLRIAPAAMVAGGE